MAGSPETGSLRLTRSRLRIASLACCALGIWLRVDYALFHHHLRHRASSDALLYLERAQDLLQRGAVPNLPATIWPPGTSALWALLSAVDPSLQLTAAWSAAASILVMPLTAAIAGLLAGSRAAWIALAIAALHPGFIHYSGFALAEQPFQLAIAVAMYLTLSALVRLEAEPPAAGMAPPPLTRLTSAAPTAAVSGNAVAGENAAASNSAASTSLALNAVRASTSPSAPPRSDPTPTGHYIQAEVVTPNDARSEARRGKLGPASPGGGSAQGKWFGRFNLKSEPAPAPEPELKTARRGFIGGRGGARDEVATATSARRSAFADRGRAEAFGRAGTGDAGARGDRDRPPGAAANEATTKRTAGLPFKAGASRGAEAGTAATREAWKGDLDPKRPAGDLIDTNADGDAARARQPADEADEASKKRAGALPFQAGGRADEAAAASREAWKGELDPNRPAGDLVEADAAAPREHAADKDASNKRGGALPFQAGGRADDAVAASREAWKGELDPNRSAGDLLKSEAPAAARDPQALANELAGQSAAADSGDSQTDAAARSAFRSGPPDDDAAAEARVEGDAARAARLRSAAEGGASDSEGATSAAGGNAQMPLGASDAGQSDAGASRTGAGSASATGSAFGASFATATTGPGGSEETREGDAGASRIGSGSAASATGSAFGASFATAATGSDDGAMSRAGRGGAGSSGTGVGDADSGLGSGSSLNAGARDHSAATGDHGYAGATGNPLGGHAERGPAVDSRESGTSNRDPQAVTSDQGATGVAGTGDSAQSGSAAAGSGDGSPASTGDSTSAPGTSPRIAAHALAGTARLWIAGAAVGCSWGLAALIRPNALPVAAVGAFALLVFSRNVVPSRAVWAALGAATAALLVLGAAANRCTATADGHFCLVSNNVAMNVALGQAGPVYGLEFHDARHPERTTTWIAPSLVQHGYQGMLQVPASVYDSTGIWSWVADRFTQDPLGYAVRAVGNAFDLFNLAYWPDEYGRYSVRAAFVLRQAWTAAVLIPALFALVTLARRAFGPTPTRPVGIFVLGTLLGLLLSAALSLGESRYRIPFDGLLIGLASATYARMTDWHATGYIPAEQLGARRWALWLPALAASIALVIALTHPSLNFGLLLPQRGAALPNRGRQDWATAADFAVPHPAGSAWNGPGTYVWKCSPDCGELQIRLGGRRRARQVHLSVDHNDRYRVLFYRSGELQAFADVPPALNTPAGLQSTVIDVPKLARTGFDAIGVQPLYGDGGYSIGHLILE